MSKSIAVSDKAYKKVIAKKGEMEAKEEMSVPMAEAVDALLEEKEKGG